MSQPSNKAKSHLWFVLASSFVVALAVVALNYFVDPYRLFVDPKNFDTSQKKPRPEQFQREIRTELAKKLPSDILIMGNSTFEIGIDPEAPELKALGKIFNHAIAGHTISAATAALDPLLAVWKPKRIFVNVSFADFVMGGRQEPIKSEPSNTSFLAMRALFSIDSTLASIEALSLPYSRYPQTLTAFGHNPMFDFQGHAITSGYRVLFDTANLRINHAFANYGQPTLLPNRSNSRALIELSKFLEKTTKERIQVTLIIPPLHNDYIQSIHKHRLATTYEEWKEHLVTVVRSLDNRDLVTVLDYSCQSKASLELIPKPGDKKTFMRWYWDSQHFKSELGTELLKSAFNQNLNTGDVGSILTFTNLMSTSFTSHHKACRDFHRQ
jgi:hypothetical protein